MNCDDCGSALLSGDNFCPRCGRSRDASALNAAGVKQTIRSLLGRLDRWYKRFSFDVVSPDRQVRDRTRVIAVVGMIVLLILLAGGGIARVIGLGGLVVLVLMPFAASLRRSI